MAELSPVLGIPGMDRIFKGGTIKAPASVLVTGVPGAGKTIFALQFIYEGAKAGEPGLFIAYDERMDNLRRLASVLGFDRLGEFEKRGLITIIEQPASNGGITSIRTPLTIIKKKKIKRVALDSLTLFEFLYSKDPLSFRRGVIEFLNYMKEYGVVLVGTAERYVGGIDNFNYELQDFLFDGIVVMFTVRKGSSFERCITVRKMRGHEHMLDIFPFTIQKGGIEVFTEQIPFSLIEK